MTEAESAAGPGPEIPEIPPPTPSEPPPRPRHSLLAWFCLLGFLVLAAALALAWFYPRTPPAPDTRALAALNGRIDQLARRLAESEAKLADLADTETKFAASEKALAARPAPPDLGPIEARLAALESRALPAPEPPTAAELATSLAPLSLRIDSLQKSLAALAKRVDGMERTARLAAAAFALEQGRPLGNLPGAPPPLARFATVAPPTLAALRLAFPEAANAERAAARPAEAGQPFAQRMMVRLGDLFTLREGNKVIVGNPAEPALASAQAALDAGNLAAAVAALASLPPPLAAPMQQWKDQAEALLAADRAMARFIGAD